MTNRFLLFVYATLAAISIASAKPKPQKPPTLPPQPTVIAPGAQPDKIENVKVAVPDTGYLLSEVEPYVPRDTEYAIEFGAMAESRSLYWLAGNMGQHLGRCLFTTSQTCQQYIDGILGVGGRDEETYGFFLGSLRWQFINFPRSWSPMVRVFAGETHAHLKDEKEWRFTYGVGIGVTTFLHERADLRFEARAGQLGDHPFVQGVMGVQFKADRLLEYFAVKLVELGITTAETAVKVTGQAVEATGTGITTVLKGAGKALGAQDETKKQNLEKNSTEKQKLKEP